MQVTGGNGLVDLLITSNSPNRCYTVLKFKNKQIDFLALGSGSRTNKAEQLVAMSLPQILKLRITGLHNLGTIEEWIEGDIHQQLRSYVTGATVQAGRAGMTFRAYAVVIIGSRHIIIREMDSEGEWIGGSRLIQM